MCLVTWSRLEYYYTNSKSAKIFHFSQFHAKRFHLQHLIHKSSFWSGRAWSFHIYTLLFIRSKGKNIRFIANFNQFRNLLNLTIIFWNLLKVQ